MPGITNLNATFAFAILQGLKWRTRKKKIRRKYRQPKSRIAYVPLTEHAKVKRNRFTASHSAVLYSILCYTTWHTRLKRANASSHTTSKCLHVRVCECTLCMHARYLIAGTSLHVSFCHLKFNFSVILYIWLVRTPAATLLDNTAIQATPCT